MNTYLKAFLIGILTGLVILCFIGKPSVPKLLGGVVFAIVLFVVILIKGDEE